MATLINSLSWTGRKPAWRFDDPGDEVVVEEPPAAAAVVTTAAVATEPEPYVPTKYNPAPVELSAYSAEQLREYGEVAEAVGVLPDALIVERFKAFLIDNSITVFSLKTVTAFMDQKSKDEGRGWGWHWRALRDKDALNVWFGRGAERGLEAGDFVWVSMDGMRQSRRERVIASDHWSPENGVYRDVVPLHALRKVALIEKAFPHQVAFMVSDYAPAPAFRVDPFLLAVVPNARLNEGVGRFVIDVWDEPGFGIEQMLGSDAL